MVVFQVMIDQMISLISDQIMQCLFNPAPNLSFNSKQMLLMIYSRCTSSVVAENQNSVKLKPPSGNTPPPIVVI